MTNIPITALSGRFYRVVFATDVADVLNGVLSPEGRFHHDGQHAIYMSPSPESAAVAVASYLKSGNPKRVTVPLTVVNAKIVDFRDPTVANRLGLAGGETSVLWRGQRESGQPATSWQASDAAREFGADGMIYSSRSAPSRWHLVLFRWNEAGGPRLCVEGPATAFAPAASA